MRCTIVLEFDEGEGSEVTRIELMRLHRDSANPAAGDVGLTLAEGKLLSNCVQQEFVTEQLGRFCAVRRACNRCGQSRRSHDSRCTELKTPLGKVFYCRERWKGCQCGADPTRYVTPLKGYVFEAATGELRWLHAELGATMPYRQARHVLDMLLPTSGRDSHVTIRNHTIAVGKCVQKAAPSRPWCTEEKPDAELGIHVGYVRLARSNHKGHHGCGETPKSASSIPVVVAALGPVGEQPRVWASAMPRTKRLQAEMTSFLQESGYGDPNEVCVLTDGAPDLVGVAADLPFDSVWVLDWAHIGRMLRHAEQAIGPLAYGRLTANGSAFELFDLFVRFRSLVWTGETACWQKLGHRLYGLLELREKRDPKVLQQTRHARYRLMDVISYLSKNLDSLIDYRAWQQAGRRISTGFVESSINRIVGRRLCKSQQMRWNRSGAHNVVQVRVAMLNHELDELSKTDVPWIGQRRVSWPSLQHPSRGF